MKHPRRLGMIAALLLALLPRLALAHAQLQSTDPAEGELVQTLPDAVTLTFSEAISPLVLRWVAPDGSTREGEGTAQGNVLSVVPPAAEDRGTHVLSWRIVSGDGHPVGGTLSFHLGSPSAQAADTGADTSTESPAALVTALFRFLLSLALVGAVGAAVFCALVSRAAPEPWLRRFGRSAAIATLPLAVLFLGFHGLDLTALAPADLLTPAPWQAAGGSPVAHTAALSALAAIAAGLALSGQRRTSLPALIAWGLAALSYAASGHVAIAPPRGLSTAAVIVHAAAMIYWTGALVPLLTSLGGPQAAIRLQRFSTIAIPMVLALILSGAVMTGVQAGSPEALIASGYGQVLGTKLALVAGLLMLAALNRLRLTPALAGGRPGAGAAMARSIRAEIVLAVLILALAAMFRLTPPPRALTVSSAPAAIHLHGAKAMADITITPARTGPVSVGIALQSGDFTALTPRAVDIALAPADGTLEPIRQSATPGEDGLWHAGPLTIPLPGEWEVTLRILITDFESALLSGTVPIGK
ncbi:MAG: CopD family protein [Tropicimonas sp.]|uniref:copper resistance CopC/CopD family protein n=1 Tax=Tropicimonas sp. TaxID=2067044 RepID=UPI003A87BC29